MNIDSFRLDIYGFSKKDDSTKKKLPELKAWEIWLGYYSLGQGHHPPSKPELVATITAVSFKNACWTYELESLLKTSRTRETNGIHFGKIHYRPQDNSNSWTGKYYQSKEEALKSFH